MTTSTLERPSASREIPIRKLDADLAGTSLAEAGVDASDPWVVPGDPVFSHFLAVLSALFPHGEEFFVATVRGHRKRIADNPVLRRQVNAFIGQEVMHGREHRDLNVRLAELGYPVDRVDAGVKKRCDLLLKLPGALPLAVTAAAEHLTGTMAEEMLEDEGTIDVFLGREGDLRSLVQWHALEELEHKNVAFDVFETVSGRYVVRALGFWIMLIVLGGFGLRSWVQNVVRDRARISRADRRTFRKNLRRQSMLSPHAARRLLGYLRPGFHPDDTDTDPIVAVWRERLADRTTLVANRAAS